MGELSLDNILDGEDLDLFGGVEVTDPNENGNTENPNDEELFGNENNGNGTAEGQEEEIDEENLFGDPESVGSEENKGEGEHASSEGNGTSPNNENFFSSNAKALAEEGVFPDLDDETINNIKTAEDFRKAIQDQLDKSLDEQQKRVKEALDNGVEPSQIKQYESTISQLDAITTESIEAEGEQGEQLRKQLIYIDFLNKGFGKERALREVEKSFKNGTDIEDAQEALSSNKAFYKDKYKELLEEAKTNSENERKELQKRAAKLKEDMFNEKNTFFDGLTLTKETRKQAYDAVSKPIFRDPETGDYMTAVQKYESEHKADFLSKVGLLYVLTDGFKSLDGLIKGKVKEERKRGLQDLERKLNNTSRSANGNLNFASGVDDTNSFLRSGVKLDI